jgi:hypothetical protein
MMASGENESPNDCHVSDMSRRIVSKISSFRNMVVKSPLRSESIKSDDPGLVWKRNLCVFRISMQLFSKSIFSFKYI